MKEEKNESRNIKDAALKVVVNAARFGDKKAAKLLATRFPNIRWRGEDNRVIVDGRVIELGEAKPPRRRRTLVSRESWKVIENHPDGEVKAFTVNNERGDGTTIEYHASSDTSPQNDWRFERRDTAEVTEIDGRSTVDEVRERIQKHYEAATGGG